MTTTTPRPPFDPVDTTVDPARRDDAVESPSLSSSNALARFEFEPGRGQDGTKVLMVEWADDDDDADATGSADWEVSWDGGKTTVRVATAGGEINRLYCMLGPGERVPTSVQLRRGDGGVAWRTNPLPAIFAPALGATAREAGRKGVLHTMWAKKRLQVLQAEIDAEARVNAEGVGLEMAVAEQRWIERHFGVVAARGSAHPVHHSPSSPGGGRLMERWKGLRVGTSAEALAAGGSPHPLSPETSDVAVGSVGGFAALKGSREVGVTPPPPPPPQKVTVARPPGGLGAERGGRMASLDAFASGGTTEPADDDDDDDEVSDLFALPISPRSPEMAKSPFSFATQDTRKYVEG